jgi:GrpE
MTIVDPMGERFDPNVHEATFEMAFPGKEPGTVFHVEQKGYLLNGRVLRPAKVRFDGENRETNGRLELYEKDRFRFRCSICVVNMTSPSLYLYYRYFLVRAIDRTTSIVIFDEDKDASSLLNREYFLSLLLLGVSLLHCQSKLPFIAMYIPVLS